VEQNIISTFKKSGAKPLLNTSFLIFGSIPLLKKSTFKKSGAKHYILIFNNFGSTFSKGG
jgi:hypothetical protein